MPDKSRQDNLLQVIIEEYIESAEPVGSNLIAEKYFKDLSSATIRNEMVGLEEKGLIFQPHPSAGRAPTIKGYQYYLAHFLSEGKISEKNKRALGELKLSSDRESIKSLAKALAELAQEAVLVGFAPSDVYYTGISNLFRQPEFAQPGLIYSMSDVIDHLDEVMAQIFNQIDEKVKVLIGQENPFGALSSAILVKYHLGRADGLIGILGPNRMDYCQNLGLIEYSQRILEKIKV